MSNVLTTAGELYQACTACGRAFFLSTGSSTWTPVAEKGWFLSQTGLCQCDKRVMHALGCTVFSKKIEGEMNFTSAHESSVRQEFFLTFSYHTRGNAGFRL
jgi:hypothetical protein